MLKIAALGSDPNGGLYVGFEKSNMDEIWRVNWEMGGDNNFERVANSISEFIEALEQKEI